MTPTEALRAVAKQALAAKTAGRTTLPLDPDLLALAKQGVVSEGTYPADLANVPIFLDSTGLLTVGGVSLY